MPAGRHDVDAQHLVEPGLHDEHATADPDDRNQPGVGSPVAGAAPNAQELGWLHKANISSGGPYGICLPDGCVDGLLGVDGMAG